MTIKSDAIKKAAAATRRAHAKVVEAGRVQAEAAAHAKEAAEAATQAEAEVARQNPEFEPEPTSLWARFTRWFK